MTAPAIFSIVPMTTTAELPEPENGPYIIATKDGYYVHRKFHFGRVLVPTKEAPATPSATPTLWTDFEKLPTELIGQAYSFFKAIYEKRKSEAMVDITWSKEHGYRLFVPPQTATGGGVNAKRNLEHYRGRIVGTIHSHCNFNAYHSGTDTHDADDHDGLHITIGDVLKDQPSIAIMISVAKERWSLELSDIIEGDLQLVPHPEWWERYVTDPKPTVQQTYSIGAWTGKRGITGPTKQNPTVVSAAPKNGYESYSLDTLVWRYGEMFTEEEQQNIVEADNLLDEIKAALDEMGIEADFAFIPTFNTQREKPRSLQEYLGDNS